MPGLPSEAPRSACCRRSLPPACADITTVEAFMKAYGKRTDKALAELVRSVSADVAEAIMEHVRAATDAAAAAWDGLIHETLVGPRDAVGSDRTPTRPGPNVLPGNEGGDDEHPHVHIPSGTTRLQYLILGTRDEGSLDTSRTGLLAHHDHAGLVASTTLHPRSRTTIGRRCPVTEARS